TYQADNDKDAYLLFRVLLAGITQESFWLSHGCSTELLQDVTRQLDWTNGQLQAATAIATSLAANPASLNATQEQLQKLGFLEHEQGELLQLLTNLQCLGFDAQLWAENGLNQAIWEKNSLRQQLFKGVNDAERGRLRRMFDIRFDRFFDWLGSLMQQQFLNQLGVVYNQPERVHINVESKKPTLRAPEDFFCTTADAPRKNYLLLRCSKKYHAQLVAALTAISEPSRDPLIAGLNQRWGPQQQDESCDEENNKEDDIAAVFTEDYSKSYEAFVKNIAGFNMQEEMRNNASSPLISPSQAIEALGHLAGDAANCLNSTIAEHYNYQLKPHTNPNGRTFASFMDEFTAKAHKGFTDFFEQFTDADIAKEVERLTPQEAAKLDVKLAEDLERFLRKNGDLEQDNQAIIDNLKSAGSAAQRDLRRFGFSCEGVAPTLEQLQAVAYKRAEELAQNKKMAHLKQQLPRFPEWLLGENSSSYKDKQG
ncbi:MAG: hypothetical protein ACRC9T_05320, partial [Vibrionaceae bacterium]